MSFEAALRASPTATALMADWCGGPVHAVVLSRDVVAADAALAARLDLLVGADVRHRVVRLVGAGVTLCDAEIWFVPERLDDAINVALETGDVPFGQLVAHLGPSREIEGLDGATVTAIVRTADGTPIAAVREVYTAALLAMARVSV